ncbi:MAG: PIN domain-containing protein [Deltaproteobacteria bacterium]|nr:PIN domain-containing protein [Deltaproteobacteria bacterium]
MQYLADTVAIIRHFSKVGKIGKAAKLILQDADNGTNSILISIISLIEILYLSERNKIPLDFEEMKHKLLQLDNYKILDLDFDIVETAKDVKGFELHDRLIVSAALFLNVPILTSDQIIRDSGIIEVIW